MAAAGEGGADLKLPPSKKASGSAASSSSRTTETPEEAEEVPGRMAVRKRDPHHYNCHQVQASLFRFSGDLNGCCKNASCQKCAYRTEMTLREQNAKAEAEAEAGAGPLSLWGFAREFRRKENAETAALEEEKGVDDVAESARIQNLSRLKDCLKMKEGDVLSDYQINAMCEKFREIAFEKGRHWEMKGKILPKEFQQVIYGTGLVTLTRKQVMKVFTGFDTDRDGYISIEEWDKVVGTKPSDYEMRKTFRTFDKTGNGWIDAEEVRGIFLGRFGVDLSEQDVKVMMKGEERLDFGGFAEMIGEGLLPQDTDFPMLLQKAFESFDTDKSGQISPAELRAGLGRLGCEINEETALKYINLIEAAAGKPPGERDGEVDIKEFCTAIMDGSLTELMA